MSVIDTTPEKNGVCPTELMSAFIVMSLIRVRVAIVTLMCMMRGARAWTAIKELNGTAKTEVAV